MRHLEILSKQVEFDRILFQSLIVSLTIGLLTTLPATAQVTTDSIVGNGNMQSQNTGVAVNGSSNGSSINNNQNNLSTGNNINQNSVSPVVITPNTYQAATQYSGVNGGHGGTSALVLPRNPLPLPNAAYGRSNFGLQFGVQNNPGLSAMTGDEDAMGFFLQGAVTIPFGKIPDILSNPQNTRLDDARLQNENKQRMVFGDPLQNQSNLKVQGKVTGLNAYNYSPTPSPKLEVASIQGRSNEPIGELEFQQPKVLALAPAEVFTRPMNTGQKIGQVEVGREYAYLGHTNQGWVKVLLPNGTRGWTSTRFEYIKFDYTQIDSLAVDPSIGTQKKMAHIPGSNKKRKR